MPANIPVEAVKREEWSKIGFILASIGSAVGLGNIWRFPYMAGSNGGGAFLIPYILGVILFGMPLMIMELDAGRKFKGSVVTTLKQINRKMRFVGIISVVIALGVLSYYLVVTGWSLAYFVFSITGFLEFKSFVSGFMPLGFFIISLAITGVMVSLGIRKGIERMSTILIPVFVALLAVLAVYSLTLPGAGEGMGFYLAPDFGYLSNINTWIMGFSQAFFSLSVGYGILLTYGSYLRRGNGITKPAITVASADTIISILGGVVIFPIVFSFGLNPAAGPELSFVSMPAAFGSMPFGNIIGMAFFFLLFIAALTSAVSILEVGAATLVDELKWNRRKSVALLSMVVLGLGMPSAFSYVGEGIALMGMPFLEFMDAFLGSMLLLSSAVLCIAIMWFYKPEVFSIPIGRIAKLKIPQTVRFMLKYLIPFILVAMLVFELVV